jgi:hypothetical protein
MANPTPYFRVTPVHLESLLAAAYAAGACRQSGPMPQEEVDGYATDKVNFLIEKGQLIVQS